MIYELNSSKPNESPTSLTGTRFFARFDLPQINDRFREDTYSRNILAESRQALLQSDILLGTPGWKTLDPHRMAASSLTDIGNAIFAREDDPEIIQAMVAGLRQVAHAIAINFPDNIYCDLDFIVGEIHRNSIGAPNRERFVLANFLLVAEIIELYGQNSPINFQYIHDFIYGFEWARWVKEDPEQSEGRALLGPYSYTFLNVVKNKALKAIEKLESEESTSAGQPVCKGFRSTQQTEEAADQTPGYRNAFSFPRDTESERLLFDLMTELHKVEKSRWKKLHRARCSQYGLRRASRRIRNKLSSRSEHKELREKPLSVIPIEAWAWNGRTDPFRNYDSIRLSALKIAEDRIKVQHN